jgi:hypothetical protein
MGDARLRGMNKPEEPVCARDVARAAEDVEPAQVDYRKARPSLELPEGIDSLDLLDRDDRF